MNKTLTWVSDVSDTADSHGNLYVNVSFDDDTVAFKGGKPDTISEHHAALAALVGKPSEFMLEDAGKSKKGKDKFKIVGYPGWEAKSSDGHGGGGGGKSWYNSEEGVRFTQDQMNRRTAAMQAMYNDNGMPVFYPVIADEIYAWLDSAPTTEDRSGVADQPRTAPNESGGAGTPVGEPAQAGPPSPPGVRTSDGVRGEAPSDREAEGRPVDPKPPTPRHAQLWSNLSDFAGSPKKALNLVNKSVKGSFTDASEIPEQTLEDVIRIYAIGEMA